MAPIPIFSTEEYDKPRRRWDVLLLLLVLLISPGCVFCSTYFGSNIWPDQLSPASLLTASQADYLQKSDGLQFAVLNPEIGIIAATEIAQLQVTPSGQGSTPASTIGFLPFTPTPTSLAPTTAVLPNPTISPESAQPEVTFTPVGNTTTPTPAVETATPSATNSPVPTDPPPPTVTTPLDTATPSPLATSTRLPTLPPTVTSIPTSTPLPPATSVPTSTPASDDDDDDADALPPPINIPPLAANDVVTTIENLAVIISVLNNDTDPDGVLDPDTLSLINGPAHGTAAVNSVTGQIIYIPLPGFTGADSFVYQICDNLGACSIATVLITVIPNSPPNLIDDGERINEDTSVVIQVLANDSDPDGAVDPNSVFVISGPANGSTLVNPTTGEITYTPNLNFNGADSFIYQACDNLGACASANVFITIIAINDPPLAISDTYTTPQGITLTVVAATGVLSNDIDIDVGDTLTAMLVTDVLTGTLTLNPNGSFAYIPPLTFVGTLTFTYRAEDQFLAPSDIATVTISIP